MRFDDVRHVSLTEALSSLPGAGGELVTDDGVVWVLFYGPEGGERSSG